MKQQQKIYKTSSFCVGWMRGMLIYDNPLSSYTSESLHVESHFIIILVLVIWVLLWGESKENDRNNPLFFISFI